MTEEQNTQPPSRKDLYINYVKEGVANLREQDLLKLRMRNIRESVKASEFNMKEYTAVVKAAYDCSKIQEEIDIRQAAIDTIEDLGL